MKTIVLEGDPLYKEGVAGGTITPGHLINYPLSALVVQATAGSVVAPQMFAIEDRDAGGEIGDNYTSGRRVKFIFPRKGDLVLAWVASGVVLTVGAALEASTGGNLRLHTTGRIIGYSEEAKTVGASAERTKVRIA